MANQLNQARSIFLAAIEQHPPQDWPCFLDEVCANDVALRQRVERLLRAQKRLGSFRDDAPHTSTTTADHTSLCERPGMVIGPYKLQEQIGEGGMGLVFVADQEKPIRRRVALKVIKPGLDSRQVIARFEAERQALAMMDHPNIAHVVDAGTTDNGRPYFVMELVKGVPITEYCDQNRLTTRQRLELFLPVCRAMQHAHQKGIIHRDLKPSNVLVSVHDVTPVVKIIDFGIAKAMGQSLADASVYTGFSQLIGTPLYMSPEQAGMSGLDVDTRSDVYSLGVLLYELLTGTTPFDAETLKKVDYDEMRRIIRDDEPPRPSARLSTLQAAALSTVAEHHGVEPRRLNQQVRGELDWIVMKCLEKDRNRRYETASALARDIERHLHDEAVEACPPSVGYRLRKLLRRHRVGAMVSAMVGLFLLVAVVGLAVSNWLIRQEQEQTRLERDRAEEARKAEVKRREMARRALDAMSSKVIEGWLARQKVLAPEHEAFLKQALAWYEELAADVGDDAESRFGMAKAHLQIGQIEKRLGRMAKAEAAFRSSVALAEQLVGEFPDKGDYRDSLAASQTNLGHLFRATGRVNEAEPTYRRAQAIWKELADEFPYLPDYRFRLSQGCNSLAGLLGETGRGAECGPLFLEAAAIQDQLVRNYPNDERYRGAAAMSHNNLGIGGEATGHPAAALVHYGRALELRTDLVRDFPANPENRKDLATTHRAMGRLYVNTQRLDEAEPAFRQALDLFTKLAEELPGVPDYRLERARMLHHLADLRKAQGKHQEAKEGYAQTVNNFEELVGALPNVPEYRRYFGSAQQGFGRLLVEMGQLDEAEKAFRKALTVVESLVSDSRDARLWRIHELLPSIQSDLGDLLATMGRPAEAEQAFRKALTLQTERVATHPQHISVRRDLANTRIRLGRLSRTQGQPAAALTWYDKAIGTLVEIPSEKARDEAWPLIRPSVFAAHEGRALAMLALGDHARAAAAAQEFAKLEKTPAPGYIYDAACIHALCSAAVQKDEKLSAADRAMLQEGYANDALKLLRDAIARGYQDVEHLKKDPDFDALRAREDFQSLLRELERKAKTTPGKKP